MAHPMMALPDHDERAQQTFIRDLKVYIDAELESALRPLTEAVNLGLGHNATDNVEALRDGMIEHEIVRNIISVKRTSQEMLWDDVGASIDRQIGKLKEKAQVAAPKGSLKLDPTFKEPAYVAAWDTHLMPGGFAVDEGEGDIRQGALMDRGGAVYMLGNNGGMMNDARAHTIVAHLKEKYPDFQPTRILEMGCGVGNTACTVSRYFPEAHFTAIDVGPAMLRYAHARAENLGVELHISQQNAEHTDFEDASFDFIFTSIVFHEVSPAAIANIIKEQHRLLKPGGVVVNLDISQKFSEMSVQQKAWGELNMHFNNEIGWMASLTADYPQHYLDAGFSGSLSGYQLAMGKTDPSVQGFFETPPSHKRFGYVTSARKSF
jgi:ubiquinone/menaquinone biosynthesis C-methylase UbiE